MLILFIFHDQKELFGTPIGTGSLYVRCDAETDSNIDFENVDEWTKWLKSQSLIKENRRLNRATETNESLAIQYIVDGGYKTLFDINNLKLYRVATSMHAGTGPLVWGLNYHQKCDAMLAFIGKKSYSLIGYINYHGSYYHYTGHRDNCILRDNNTPFSLRPEDEIFDLFRTRYALRMSMVYPEHVRFVYKIVYECDFFHGPKDFVVNNVHYDTIKQAVVSNPDHIYSFRFSKLYNLHYLIQGITNGSITGFVTLRGGFEKPSEDSNDFFGYCVQQYTPTSNEISDYTSEQLKRFKNIQDIPKYLAQKQIGLTLNSGTFHSEETISTIYLQWLIQVRNFYGFEITHFIEYKFATHCKLFLEPLLQQRHEAKKKKDFVSTECIKLLCNGSFGYNAIESSNYNTCRIIKGNTLHRYATVMSGYLSLENLQLIGIVNIENKFDFLYSVIVSGEDRPINNSIPKAVAILSNSKKLFLSHIQILLECLDPALAELCYIDTDSCIFSFTHSSLLKCIKKDKLTYFLNKNIIVTNENCKKSFHGKLKCEGVYAGGRFRTIKIYRLYNNSDLYTRCKGVNRFQADTLPNSTFNNFDQNVTTIKRRTLKPTPAGEMCIAQESLSLACPANLKRYVLPPHGLHTLPLSIGWMLKK